MRTTLIFLHVCLCLSGVLGCGKADPVVARANGQDIKQSELDAYIKLKHLDVTTPEAKANALEDYVSRFALASTIQSEDSEEAVTPAEIEDFKKGALISRHFKKLLDDKVTDQAIEDYYKQHTADFVEQKAHIAQILLQTQPTMTVEQRKEKLAAAKAAHAQLQAGKDFVEIAAAVSEDAATNKSGGDLGWLTSATAPNPGIFKRAQALKPGDYTEPFLTPQGYCVIKLVEPLQSNTKPLQLARNEIQQRLREQLRSGERERLLAKAKIEVEGKPHTESKQEAASDVRADR